MLSLDQCSVSQWGQFGGGGGGVSLLVTTSLFQLTSFQQFDCDSWMVYANQLYPICSEYSHFRVLNSGFMLHIYNLHQTHGLEVSVLAGFSSSVMILIVNLGKFR